MNGALHVTIGGFASLLVTAPCLATTWIVDDNGGPGVDFVTILAAVGAAADGDVIEVRPGNYPGFSIDGKSLVVTSDGTGRVRVAAVVLVRDVPAGGAVELDGLEIGATIFSPSFPALRVEQCQGAVRVVDCVVTGESSSGDCDGTVPRHALRAVASDEVVVLRCELDGGSGFFYDSCYYYGASALRVDASHVTVLDSRLVGGDGSDPYYAPGFDGGHGAELVTASTLLLHRSELVGGGAGSGGGCGFFCQGAPCGPVRFDCGGPGTPGSGLSVEAASSVTWKDTIVGAVVGAGSVTEVRIAPTCLGTFEECPCGNHGAGSAGCEHAFGLGGVRLAGVGNASVAADTVTLQAAGFNPNVSPAALFFQGTLGSEGTPFGDGLLCAGGTIRRMKGKAASNGTVSFGFGQPGDAAVSVAGAVPPAGATRFYQVWYRNNNASYCTPLRFNMSNGVEIAWAP